MKKTIGCSLLILLIFLSSCSGEKGETALRDPYLGISLCFTGTAPHGNVRVECTSDEPWIRSLQYEVKPSKNLMNGDLVTLKARLLVEAEDFKKRYGFLPDLKKPIYFTVTSLSEYVQNGEEIPGTVLEKMKSKSLEKLSSQHSEAEVHYLGYSFLCHKEIAEREKYLQEPNFCILYFQIVEDGKSTCQVFRFGNLRRFGDGSLRLIENTFSTSLEEKGRGYSSKDVADSVEIDTRAEYEVSWWPA